MKSAKLGVCLTAFFVVLFGLILFGALPKVRKRQAVAKAASEFTGPRRVLVSKASVAPSKIELTLPANVAPFHATTLYPRATGFVRRYNKELGDTVKAGDVLAEIYAPETQEELRLAQAKRNEAEVNLGIANSIADRSAQLSREGVASKQEADEQRARANSAVATLGTTNAEVGRIGALLRYQRVVAPFDGVITRRGIEAGALVSPSGGAQGTVLFEIAKLDQLRVFIDVPQNLASFVHIGSPATVFTPSNPKVLAHGSIVRTSRALDPNTRTLRAEVHIDGKGPILAGAFASVRFGVERPSPPVVIPSSALLYRKDGLRAAVVAPNDTLRFAKITVLRDLGKELEIDGSVSAGETIVVNPPDDLTEGMQITKVEPNDGSR